MNSLTNSSVASINGAEPTRCTLEVTQHVEYIPSIGGTKPDLTWTFVDGAGHFHAYSTGGTLPTLRVEPVHASCDCCEECVDSEYRCVICDSGADSVLQGGVSPLRQSASSAIPSGTMAAILRPRLVM